jgi:hypothetical protein
MNTAIAGLFAPGKVVMTRSVVEHVPFLKKYLYRHLRGDWGDLADEDKNENDLAVKAGDLRIFSAYETDIEGAEKIWIITEADRSATTILLPSDY